MKIWFSVIFSLAILSGCNCSYSDGARVGVVNKLSRKGLLCKTWEGEANLGGFRNQSDSDGNSTVVANVFQFTVDNDSAVTQLQSAMEAGARVRLTYHEVAFANPCSTDSGYFVTKVEVLQ